ncbi:uncharacterized protein LOC129752388 [Uranotaenia lowii]|uniref:uncharacterized protein LOC129738050 n=1 Tax=Uranotaenia lowii TaxID=190385 RepID=UPI002479F34C|nr:uncharacterized protein LOC129738050 [Uranotaenia lowii]XP_055604153.1 uncharacterized protein LOC129752388 [Uranotaenia lowii]
MSGFWHESDVSMSEESENETHANGMFNEEDVLTMPQTIDSGVGFGNEGQKPTLPTAPAEKRITQETTGRAGFAADWLAGAWPLKPFDGALAANGRKAEWIRFRDQFERIASCKARVDSRTKLTGMKIFAGGFLLNIIELQEQLVTDAKSDIYDATVSGLNKYFNQTCDHTKERMKFRDMCMSSNETFTDWVLRLEGQVKFCEFRPEQREEELLQALLRRSIPEISRKLYEISDVLGNNLERIIDHGKHLDFIRSENSEPDGKVDSTKELDHEFSNDRAVKPVNALHTRHPINRGIRTRNPGYESFGNQLNNRGGNQRFRNQKHFEKKWSPLSQNIIQECDDCGKEHRPRSCKAFRAKCFSCGKRGHYAEFCRSTRNKVFSDRDNGPERQLDLKKESSRINQVDIEDNLTN